MQLSSFFLLLEMANLGVVCAVKEQDINEPDIFKYVICAPSPTLKNENHFLSPISLRWTCHLLCL